MRINSSSFCHICVVQARALDVPTTIRRAKKKRTLGSRVDAFVRDLYHKYNMSTVAIDSFCLAVHQLKNKQTTVVGALRQARTALLPECENVEDTRWRLTDKLQELRIFQMSEAQFIVSEMIECATPSNGDFITSDVYMPYYHVDRNSLKTPAQARTCFMR